VPVYLDVTKQELVDEAYETITADAAQRGIQIAGVVNNVRTFLFPPHPSLLAEKCRPRDKLESVLRSGHGEPTVGVCCMVTGGRAVGLAAGAVGG
jgi:hypothetical protein